jgi:hypothetical protein
VPCPPPPAATDDVLVVPVLVVPLLVVPLLVELVVPDPLDPVVAEPAAVVELVEPALPVLLPDFGTEFVSSPEQAPKHALKTPIASAPRANHFLPCRSLIMTSRKRHAFPCARRTRN